MKGPKRFVCLSPYLNIINTYYRLDEVNARRFLGGFSPRYYAGVDGKVTIQSVEAKVQELRDLGWEVFPCSHCRVDDNGVMIPNSCQSEA